MGLVERVRCSKELTYLSVCLEAGVWNYKVGVKNSKLSHVTGNLSRLMSKPTKWVCAQPRLRSAWASSQSDQSSLSAWKNLNSLATQWAHSEDSDQTGRMPRLICVFAGRTATLLVLWRGGSFVILHALGSEMRLFIWKLGLVAWLDACPPGMQTVACLILETGSILCGDWSWNHFYSHSLPTTDSSRAVVSYWWKDVHFVLVKRLGSLPRNSLVRITDLLHIGVSVHSEKKISE